MKVKLFYMFLIWGGILFCKINIGIPEISNSPLVIPVKIRMVSDHFFPIFLHTP